MGTINYEAASQKPRISSIPFVLAAVNLLLHIITNGNYGMFRDEYYYIACAKRLAWGYVDQPPLSLGLLAGWMRPFGNSVESIRMLPAVAGASAIILTALIVRELGGRRFAQALAALCMAIAPVYLVLTGFFSMNAFDLLFWILAFYLLAYIVRTGNAKLYILMGVLLGLGLLNKISVLFLGLGLAVGLILTPHRRFLKSGYLWAALAIALALFVPHVLWQISNGWPTLEFMSNAKQYKITATNPVEYFIGQIVIVHPAISPVWLIGLFALLFWKGLSRYRIIGLIYVVALLAFMIQRGKVYYLSPAYPPLIAAGAIAIERFVSRGRRRWLAPVIIVVILAWGSLTVPLALPILAPEKVASYQTRVGLAPPSEEVNDELAPLPPYFADRFGWENMVRTVASVYRRLNADERAQCIIFTDNYGQAGAIDYFGPLYGLPGAICGHNNYYLWGPGDKSGELAIVFGVSREKLESAYEEVEEVAVVVSPFAMPWETNREVYVCRRLKVPFEELWRRAKSFI